MGLQVLSLTLSLKEGSLPPTLTVPTGGMWGEAGHHPGNKHSPCIHMQQRKASQLEQMAGQEQPILLLRPCYLGQGDPSSLEEFVCLSVYISSLTSYHMYLRLLIHFPQYKRMK